MAIQFVCDGCGKVSETINDFHLPPKWSVFSSPVVDSKIAHACCGYCKLSVKGYFQSLKCNYQEDAMEEYLKKQRGCGDWIDQFWWSEGK